MSQHDYNLANAAGAAFRADANDALAAIVSNNSGATAPSTTFPYQWWADTTTGLLKIRNAANSAWITVGTLASTLLGHQAQDATLDSLAGLSLAQGDILYATAADTLARLAKGSASQQLRMNSGATAPEWFTPASSSAITAGTALVKNPIAFSSTTTQAHGLGARPTLFNVALECLTAEYGYSVGDIINYGDGLGGGSNYGINILSDATNTTLLISPAIAVVHKTSYTGVAITAANWKITVTPYKVG